jgi:hypothetical protein
MNNKNVIPNALPLPLCNAEVLNSIPYAKAQKKAMAGWMAARMDVIS